jgi:hypothetical protein
MVNTTMSAIADLFSNKYFKLENSFLIKVIIKIEFFPYWVHMITIAKHSNIIFNSSCSLISRNSQFQ